MRFWLFSAASGLALSWLILHLTLGERDIGSPLRQSNALEPMVRETQYVCWHFATVSMACMVIFFGLAAFLNETMLAAAGVALSSGFAVCGIGIVAFRGADHRVVPQGWLFVPVAALGVLGLLT